MGKRTTLLRCTYQYSNIKKVQLSRRPKRFWTGRAPPNIVYPHSMIYYSAKLGRQTQCYWWPTRSSDWSQLGDVSRTEIIQGITAKQSWPQKSSSSENRTNSWRDIAANSIHLQHIATFSSREAKQFLWNLMLVLKHTTKTTCYYNMTTIMA